MNAGQLLLSRARLRRQVPASALRAVLLPSGEAARTAASHRLVWTLFADAPDRQRDFLWRESDAGVFYLLSNRPPEDRHGLFDLDPPEPFTPVLAAGDRLAFALRANATVTRSTGSGSRGQRCDVVMDALYGAPAGQRARQRAKVVRGAARGWLAAQGVRCGFTLPVSERCDAADEDADERRDPLRVLSYRTLRIDRGRGAAMRIGVLDLEGTLEVRDPAVFVAALGNGFGRAKAFGCGLMLIRRAPARA